MSKPKPHYTVETLEPDTSFGYLMKRCGTLMGQIAERRFEALSISFTQWMVLALLQRRDAPISATQLAAELPHDMGALTRVVDELERRGFVGRERSRRDRRAVEIGITPAGRRQAQDGKRVIVGLLNQFAGLFSERELDTLITLLQRLHSHLQHAAEADAPQPAAPAGAGAARGSRQPGRSPPTAA